MKNSSNNLDPSIVSDLVTAILAVNGWTLEKVWKVIPEFEKRGLLEPSKVSAMDVGDVTVKLTESGFNRGMLNGMMAERLKALMTEIQSGKLVSLPEFVSSGNKQKLIDTLCEIRGVGPSVANNAWMLMTTKK